MSPLKRRRLLPARIGLGLVALIGATMTYVGVVVWKQTHWPMVTSRATSCSPVYSTRRSLKYGNSTRLAGQSCSVTWQIDGQTHVGVVELAASTRDGEDVKLYVNGDSALSDHTQSGGLLVGGIGVAILGFAVGLPLSAWIRKQRSRQRREGHNRGVRRPSTADGHRRATSSRIRQGRTVDSPRTTDDPV